MSQHKIRIKKESAPGTPVETFDNLVSAISSQNPDRVRISGTRAYPYIAYPKRGGEIFTPHPLELRIKLAIGTIIKTEHVGKANAITGKNLLGKLKRIPYSIKTSQRKMRKLIHQMRNDRVPICSEGGHGYFWPESHEEGLACIAKEFRAKATDMLATAKQMESALLDEFGSPQMILPLENIQ